MRGSKRVPGRSQLIIKSAGSYVNGICSVRPGFLAINDAWPFLYAPCTAEKENKKNRGLGTVPTYMYTTCIGNI